MKKVVPLAVPLLLLAQLALVPASQAQIDPLTLPEMAARADGAFIGTIEHAETIRIDHPIDGPELYFTTLTLKGRSLGADAEETLQVSYAGGFFDPDHGSWNSTAPSQNSTQLGNQVLVFYSWTDNMGGDFAANALYAAQGGLYSTFESPSGETIVQGRGSSFAIASNRTLDQLEQEYVDQLAQQNGGLDR